jgi:uncharacterized protein (TIGR00369 family)
MPRMTAEQIDAFMVEVGFEPARAIAQIESIGERTITMRMPFRAELVRPGGTLSGPSLMALADVAAYYLILAMQGPLALAVTTSFNINFLTKPAQADVIADARMLKMGKKLAIVAIEMRSVGGTELVAHATATYALPSR